jgi:hypothetical protein
MATDISKIKPGSMVQVKIVKRPTSRAAVETLKRVFYKDATVAREARRHQTIRRHSLRRIRRGGRLYRLLPPKLQLVWAKVGEIGTVRASVDVLGDLSSVSRFVEITAAK